jgi:hypothetical protein
MDGAPVESSPIIWTIDELEETRLWDGPGTGVEMGRLNSDDDEVAAEPDDS